MRRPLLAVALVSMLAACDGRDARAPFTDSRPPASLAPRFWTPPGWAWGLIETSGRPAVRYGVAGPAAAPRAHILLLTGYGESAEAYFETVRDLTARRYVVWVLERAGQGGSGRYAGRRDLGAVASLDDDAAAARAMIDEVIRPRPGQPLVMVGQGLGGTVAAMTLGHSTRGVDGAVLSAPLLRLDRPPGLDGKIAWARRLGLSGLRPSRDGGWKRAARRDPEDRAGVQNAWQTANPDLRMGSPGLGWYGAVGDALSDLERRPVGDVAIPVLTLEAAREAEADLKAQDKLCGRLPDCRVEKIPDAGAGLPFEADGPRGVWLAAIVAFTEAKIPKSPAP